MTTEISTITGNNKIKQVGIDMEVSGMIHKKEK